ncbi:kinase-like protein [Aspergillus ellipticus CBS 707.79]|uniref:Kinase-like protein n=1 Tax=Aspergillus ellipticus CBS 707.79 TaxID=1448320 RepID=A0A319EVX6_9EURO|nr:kinase-like protein [Aspergillus ellipticus CBS 707.79]
MNIPWNIRGSASQFFFQDTSSFQYQALLAITDLPHPDRSILGAFLEGAVDPEEGARYFLQTTRTRDGSGAPKEAMSQFVSQWLSLVGKFRPILATSLSEDTKKLVYDRDGGCCCVTRTPFKSHVDSDLQYVHLVPPDVRADPDLSAGTYLFAMLRHFLPNELIQAVWAPQHEQRDRLDNIWLLSTQAFHAFQAGEVFLTTQRWGDHSDTARKQTYSLKTNWFKPEEHTYLALLMDEVLIENRIPQLAPILNQQLLGVHARFSESLAWIDTKKHMIPSPSPASRSPTGDSCQPIPCGVGSESLLSTLASPVASLCRTLWTALPSFVRAPIYDILVRIGAHIYGPSLSMTVFKLPFGLYLRRGATSLTPKYHAEAHTLRIVERYTSIPAPRAIDVLETSRHAYMLMTCVPGRPIGLVLDIMTDDQLKQAVHDLKRYVAELRQIPPSPTEYQICNSQGDGVLDWRIPDSSREQLRFKTEADFNKYLTDPFWADIRTRAAKSHGIPHDIVFTHGDLNPRNILAENGRITGIVDWENAGWFPEYWEYTKAHYTVRSLKRWLADVVDVVFEGYREELWVENMLSDLLGPF